jgi:hypothetical protein
VAGRQATALFYVGPELSGVNFHQVSYAIGPLEHILVYSQVS